MAIFHAQLRFVLWHYQKYCHVKVRSNFRRNQTFQLRIFAFALRLNKSRVDSVEIPSTNVRKNCIRTIQYVQFTKVDGSPIKRGIFYQNSLYLPHCSLNK